MGMEEYRPMRNPIIKQIDSKVKKTGYDVNFAKAAAFHLRRLRSFESADVNDRDDLCNMLLAKLFLDKIDMYPEKRFSCKVDEKSDWAVPLVPVEIFRTLPDNFRISCFYEFLKEGDILDCRVASVLPTEYSLRVIHKYGCTKILDDLNLMVKLPRNKKDIQLLEEELLVRQLIRVTVSQVSRNNREVIVTLNKSRETKVDLGRIDDDYLPSYVLDPPDCEKYSSYASYLSSMPQFEKNFSLLQETFVNFGLDDKMIYSFHPSLDRLVSPKENTGHALLRKSKMDDAKNYAEHAFNSLKEENVEQALSFINLALELCPKEQPLKTTLYQIKGDIYKGNAKFAVMNYVIAHYLDGTNEKVKQQLSKYFFKTANGYYRSKSYRKAFIYAETSYALSNMNYEASYLLEHLKKKHPEDASNALETESLLELHKKKQKLVSKLKKFKEERDP